MLLSIVIPFYNASQKIGPLIETLTHIRAEDVEVLFVDDGSADNERVVLANSLAKLQCHAQLFSQENMGPGAARNLGTRSSHGKYLWFVDADDNINLDAIHMLRSISDEDFDFIDFDLEKKGLKSSSMAALPGFHDADGEDRCKLIEGFGRLWTKIFRKEFIRLNNLLYPENCIYEDNYLAFLMPLYVSRFFRSETTGYYHNVDGMSITRTKDKTIDPKYFDRLFTAKEGAARALALCSNASERSAVIEKMRNLFLLITLAKFVTSGNAWVLIYALCGAYKHVVEELLTEQEVSDEYPITRRMLLVAAGEESRRAAHAWDASYPEERSLKDFTSERNRAWGAEIVYFSSSI